MSSSISISEADERGLARAAQRQHGPGPRVWVLRGIGIVLGGLLLALLLQLMLSQLPVVAGIHFADPKPDQRSAHYVPGAYTNSLSWDLRQAVNGRVNNQGFLSPHDYRPGEPAVGLFGDSFVEGLMIDYDASLPGQVQRRVDRVEPAGGLPKPATAYNFGFSGAGLPHYLGLASEMASRFTLSAAVLVVIPGDYEEGFKQSEGHYGWTDDPEAELVNLNEVQPRSGWKKIVRQSALYRYLHGNLAVDGINLFGGASAEAGACKPATLTPVDQRRIDRYVDELPRALRLPPDKIVVVFNNTPYPSFVYDPVDKPARAAAAPCPTRDILARERLRERIAAAGFRIVDTTPLLRADYQRHRRLLDLSPVDGHWNERALALVGEAVVDQLARR